MYGFQLRERHIFKTIWRRKTVIASTSAFEDKASELNPVCDDRLIAYANISNTLLVTYIIIRSLVTSCDMKQNDFLIGNFFKLQIDCWNRVKFGLDSFADGFCILLRIIKTCQLIIITYAENECTTFTISKSRYAFEPALRAFGFYLPFLFVGCRLTYEIVHIHFFMPTRMDIEGERGKNPNNWYANSFGFCMRAPDRTRTCTA